MFGYVYSDRHKRLEPCADKIDGGGGDGGGNVHSGSGFVQVDQNSREHEIVERQFSAWRDSASMNAGTPDQNVEMWLV